MEILFVIIVGGIIFALIMSQIDIKLRALKTNFNAQLQQLNKKIQILEQKLQNPKASSEDSQTDDDRSIDLPEIKIENPKDVPLSHLTMSAGQTSLSEPQIKSPKSNNATQSYSVPQSPPSVLSIKIQRLKNAIVQFFKTGNTVAKVGIVVLFFGVSFLLKFASDIGMFPVEYRLMSAAVAGIILTHLGWHQRLKKRSFGLIAQGGGIGILFITTFLSYMLYHLIPSPLAFALMGLLSASICILAVFQNSQSLASLGVVGGFLAPLLASSGSGQFVVLFSYYAIINSGIAYMSYYKPWRILNLLGFVLTTVVQFSFVVLFYDKSNWEKFQIFPIFYFLLYLIISIFYTHKQKLNIKRFVDGALLFANPVLFLVIQSLILKHQQFGLAISSLFVAVIYLFTSKYLLDRKINELSLLIEAFIGIGGVAATLTIPFAFDGTITAAVWAIEGAGLYWISVRQKRDLGRYLAIVLVVISGFLTLEQFDRRTNDIPFLNKYFIACFMVSMGAFFISYFSNKYKKELKKPDYMDTTAILGFAHFWWAIRGTYEVRYQLVHWLESSSLGTWQIQSFPAKYTSNFSLLFWAFGFVLTAYLGRRLRWENLLKSSYLLFFFFVISILEASIKETHPFAYAGYIIWPVAIIGLYFILVLSEKYPNFNRSYLNFGHAVSLWIVALVGSWELGRLAKYFLGSQTAWVAAARGVLPVFIAWLVIRKGKSLSWPIGHFKTQYIRFGIGPIVAFTWIWVLYTNWFDSGNVDPIFYVPLLNPLELVHILFLVILPIWLFTTMGWLKLEKKYIGIVVGGTYFLWLNGALMRAIHHYADIPYRFETLFSSPLVQASLSIYWSIIGIALMVYSSKKVIRWLWLTGGGLMGVVVVKLFLVDLSNSDTIERIVSFISVGIVLMAIGYFSPLPPKEGKVNERNS